MKIKKAVEILEYHNKWRRGVYPEKEMVKPNELGIAIDTVVNHIHKEGQTAINNSTPNY